MYRTVYSKSNMMAARLLGALLFCLCLGTAGEAWGQEEGLASYYHDRFHGRVTSSGRVHDNDELVAAHRTYPFGTFLRVTNLDNMRSVIVCVTDRGPYHGRRIIDVSESAADSLGFIERGVARVRLEVVPGPLDLRYLDLIYPRIPFLDTDETRVEPPYRLRFSPSNR